MVIILALFLLLLIVLLLLVPVRVFGTLRSWRQTLNWEASLLLAGVLAFLGYFRIHENLGPPIPLPAFVFWALKLLAIISPACLAIAWLRWSGVKWATALLLLPIVPVVVFTIWLVRALPYYMG